MLVQNKHVLVVGLARSGLAVAHALARHGAIVTVTDRKPPSAFADALPQLMKDKIGVELGMQREETFLRHHMIVTSPGVPWDLPQLQAARQRAIPVYPEVEAAAWFLQGTLVGITGSNGKTTTTALLGDMLKASGFPTFVGGNIGSALSSAVDKAVPGTKFVTELSSFQLEGIQEFHPQVAVMLNLSPNHLDRHPTLEAYAQAKRQIFRNQRAQDYAVLNADDPWVAGLEPSVASHPILFSRQRELPYGVFLSGGKIYYRVRHLERVLFEARDVNLRGDFNLEDVLAATTAACVLGADFNAIRRAVRAFQAVEHRLEFVREIQGVSFYNNSKATSVDATLKSLEAFDHGVHLILGGKDKGAPYTPLIPLIKERVREVLLIGAAAPVIAQQLAGTTELVQAGDLGKAVFEAFLRARPGDTILLAPACSSFDQFTDYEERGRVFKELVRGLRETGPKSRDTGKTVGESAVGKNLAGVRVAESGVQKAAVPSPPAFSNLKSEIAASQPEVVVPAPRIVAAAPGPEGTAAPAEASVSAGPEGGAKKEDAGAGAAMGGEQRAESGSSAAALQRASRTDDAIADAGAAGEAAATRATEPVSAPAGESSQPAAGEATPEPRVASPESRTPPTRPHHIELHYVYEVDAMEMPAGESQEVGEDEPVMSMTAEAEEGGDDEALPFETRQTPAGPRRPESEVDKTQPGAPSTKQPGLFNGGEK